MIHRFQILVAISFNGVLNDLKQLSSENRNQNSIFDHRISILHALNRNIQLYASVLSSSCAPFLVVCDLNDEINFSFSEISSAIQQHLNHQYVLIQNAKSVKSSNRMRGGLCKQTVGIPQGSIVAPLLCAIHFAALDSQSEETRDLLLRWVDDFLFITWEKSHAYQFVHSLVSERNWGDNINFEKLCSNNSEVMKAIKGDNHHNRSTFSSDNTIDEEFDDDNGNYRQGEPESLSPSNTDMMIEWASLKFDWGRDGKINIKATHGKKSTSLWSSIRDKVIISYYPSRNWRNVNNQKYSLEVKAYIER